MDSDALDILIKLSKSKKAVSFYPTGHPVLKQILDSLFDSIKEWMNTHEEFCINIKSNQFYFGNEPLPMRSPEIRDLVKTFSQLQVQQLVFNKEINADELILLLKTLSIKPSMIQAQGGLYRVLYSQGMENFTIQEIDYGEILDKQAFDIKTEEEFEEGKEFVPGEQELEEEEQEPETDEEDASLLDLAPEVETERPDIYPEKVRIGKTNLEKIIEAEIKSELTAEQIELRNKLLKLEKERDPKIYFELIQQLISLCESMRLENLYSEVLLVVSVLKRHHESKISSEQKLGNDALYGIQMIGTPELIKYTFDFFFQKDILTTEKDFLSFIVLKIGPSLVEPLIEIMETRKDITSRRTIIQALALFGPDALNSLHKKITDKRWHVVRDIAITLGEIGHPRSVIYLEEALSHPNAHVRREAVRALSKIPTVEAFELLLLELKKDNIDTRVQAINILGESKNPAALEPLLKQAKKLSLSSQTNDLKKTAIIALGNLADQRALPFLEKVLFSKGWSGLTGNQELRIAAAQAVVNIGGEKALNILQKCSKSEDLQLRQTCENLLEMLQDKT